MHKLFIYFLYDYFFYKLDSILICSNIFFYIKFKKLLINYSASSFIKHTLLSIIPISYVWLSISIISFINLIILFLRIQDGIYKLSGKSINVFNLFLMSYDKIIFLFLVYKTFLIYNYYSCISGNYTFLFLFYYIIFLIFFYPHPEDMFLVNILI